MWIAREDFNCPECGECCVEQFVLTDEANNEHWVGARHKCGWRKVYIPELEEVMNGRLLGTT